MQLTTFTDYCLRVLMYLAVSDGPLAKVGAIARSYGVSHHHLIKVAQHLSARGYVRTVRGKNGGMCLSREPRFINIGEVVRDCEESLDVVECFDAAKAQCPLFPACVLRAALKDATNTFLATLDRCTLADLVSARQGPAGAKLVYPASAGAQTRRAGPAGREAPTLTKT